jgi:hypothetical protein
MKDSAWSWIKKNSLNHTKLGEFILKTDRNYKIIYKVRERGETLNLNLNIKKLNK